MFDILMWLAKFPHWKLVQSFQWNEWMNVRFIYIELIIDQLEDRHCLNLYKYTLKTFFLIYYLYFFLFVVASVSYSLLVNYSSGHSLCFFFFSSFFLVKKIIILWWIAPLNPYSQWIYIKKDALSTRQLDRIQQTDSVASIHDNNIS